MLQFLLVETAANEQSAGDYAPIGSSLARLATAPIFSRESWTSWDCAGNVCCFRVFAAVELLIVYRIDPINLTDAGGSPCGLHRAGRQRGSFRLELLHSGDSPEPMAELELADTPSTRSKVVWVALQIHQRLASTRISSEMAKSAPVDQTEPGFQEAAMLAGLAPGQVRQGLRGVALAGGTHRDCDVVP